MPSLGSATSPWGGKWLGAWNGPPTGGVPPSFGPPGRATGTWGGVWLGNWYESFLSGQLPPPGEGSGSIITGGYATSQVIVQGYGSAETSFAEAAAGGVAWGGLALEPPEVSLSGPGSVITGGYGTAQIIVQGYGLGGGSSALFVTTGGMMWGGVTGLKAPIPETFLQALVEMLRGSTPLTAALGGPRIYSTWPGPKTPLPFLVVEDYVESQPGETIEHNVNTAVIAAYGADKVSVKTVLMAAMKSTDSPAQDNNSTRVPMQWSLGTEESCWRQPTLPPMRTKIKMRGTDLWTWKIQYDFNILPNFQV